MMFLPSTGWERRGNLVPLKIEIGFFFVVVVSPRNGVLFVRVDTPPRQEATDKIDIPVN